VLPVTLPELNEMRILVSRQILPEPVSKESMHAVEQAVERLAG
jgi:hypothetical protein